MPINFPANPTNNQVYTFGGKVWTFNGKGWYTATPSAANLLTVSTAIIPTANVAYDIGAPGARFRDLYLSANTIDLGGTAIKTTANGVSFANAANTQIAVPLTVSSVQLATGANIITIQATATGLQAIGSSGTAVPVGGASVTVSNSAPVGASLGSLWLDSDTGDMYAFYGNAWAEFGKSGGSTTQSGGSANVTTVSDQVNLSTGYIDLPSGTTAQRPVSPPSGAMRFNTSTGYGEIYNTAVGQWLQFGTNPILDVEYLVVAGGGGGSASHGGGGGGGGYRTGTLNNVNVLSAYTVTIGAGGAASGIASSPGGDGNNAIFSSITS